MVNMLLDRNFLSTFKQITKQVYKKKTKALMFIYFTHSQKTNFLNGYIKNIYYS